MDFQIHARMDAGDIVTRNKKFHRRVKSPVGTNINQLNYYEKETNIKRLHEREF